MNVTVHGPKFSTFIQKGLVTSGAATADVAAAGFRNWITIQNDSVNPLKVYGCAAASQADASLIFVLAPASANLQGDGGTTPVLNYEGPISVAGTGIRYIVAEA